MSDADRKKPASRVTLIVVGDETAPVRRFQVPKSMLGHAVWIGALVLLAILAGAVDYVRLRIDAVDVEKLRAETAQQQAELTDLTLDITSLEQDLARIREFERKVRVIANLPAAMLETQVAGGGRGGEAKEASAQDGGLDAVPARTAPLGSPRPASATPGAADPAPGQPAPSELAPAPAAPADDLGPTSALELDGGAVARIRTKALRLSEVASLELDSFEDLIERLQGKAAQLASTPSIWPTEGWVTSGYGYRKSPFTGKRKFHAGIDIAASFGTEVVAPARGKVVFVGRKGPLGKTVAVDHGYGMRTSYGHLAEIFVKLGQEVERGQRIAAVGSTGRSTGPHLHYAVAVEGKSVNPVNYILE